MMLRRVSRRRFLQAASTAAAGLALPQFIPASAWGANERIVTGHIGVGGQGRGNLGGFGGTVGAICDVDQNHLARAIKSISDKQGQPEGYTDYRKLLERKDIDAVVISTPDHWHALQTIHACQAGKDVYVEKPLSLTILDGRKMVDAARKHGRIVQTGSQQRSAGNFRTACELVRSGRIGKLQTVLVGIPGPNHPGQPGADADPPEELNYELWLGPAPFRPYNAKRVHYNFRFYSDYSGGQLTNWGAHHIDIAQWGIGADDSGPLEVVAESAAYHPQQWHEVTEKCRVVFTYADGVKLIVGQGEKDVPGGTTFIGSQGEIRVNRGHLSSTPEEIVKQPIGDGDVRLYASNNHKGDFAGCIKSRELPICDVEIGHRSATVCHLANIACKLGRPLRWDPAKEQFVGDSEAAAMVHRPYRQPWTL
jgi:predicted dehydrogenase